jgi:penicillin-binding protein 2
MQLTTNGIKKRIFVINIWLGCAIVLIISVLFQLQVYNNNRYFLQSKKNYTRHEYTASLRGTIFDRHGTPLATNRPVSSLVWHGSGKKTLSKEQQQLLVLIKQITDYDFMDNPQLVRAERRGDDFLLIKDLNFQQLSKLSEQIAHYENIILSSDFARHYPHGKIASHVLGYFRETQNQSTGTMGLERIFEEQLRGEPGKLEKTINSIGKKLHSKELQKALAGENMYTTIDFQMQTIAEKLFENEQSGTLLVMSPHTGDLHALASYPSFDPNVFLHPISTAQWQEIKDKKPFANRSINACYPPASLFKLITTTAALEEGIITTDSTWKCRGQIIFGGRPYLCNKRYEGHGPVTIEEALAKSCNIPFYEIGKQLTIDTLANYAHKLGLGEKTGIILPDKTGLIPTSEWKQLNYGEPWWQGETLNASIGQGPLLTTPLQMARTIGGICTGTLVRPRILLDESINFEPVAISQNTLDFLRQSMRMTVQEGTGKQLKKLEDFEIYAKTGTAQTSHRSKRKQGKEFMEHAWFICYAQYKQHDPIVLVILIEHVGSARFATRMARDFFVEYAKLLDKRDG